MLSARVCVCPSLIAWYEWHAILGHPMFVFPFSSNSVATVGSFEVELTLRDIYLRS